MIDFASCKKYLLSLEKRNDRRDKFFKQKIQFTFDYFKAVETKDIYYTGRLKASQVACKISHLRMIQDAKENKHEYVCIFEDDAKVVDGFDSRIDILAQVPIDWDMVYLGAHHYYKPTYVLDGIGKCVCSLSTVAYMVHSRMYDIIINELKKDMILDVIYTNIIQQKYNCYCLFPNLVTQDYGYSDIERVKVNYDKFYSKWQ